MVARAKDAVDYRLLARQQASAPSYGDLSDLDLKNALLSVWRHKAIVFWTMLVCAFLAAAVVLSMTPMYTATVKVLLLDQKEPTFGMAGLETTSEDQLAVVTSNIVAERVIEKYNLAADAEFNEALQQPPAWRAYIPRLPRPQWLNELLGRTPPERTEDLEGRVQRERIVGAFLDRLAVDAVPNSSVLDISFSSERPAVAATLADAVANSYLQQRLEDKFDEVQRTTGWLSERIAELRKQVETAEAAVESFRRQSGLVGPNPGETVLSQQITQLSSELITARTQRAEREVAPRPAAASGPPRRRQRFQRRRGPELAPDQLADQPGSRGQASAGRPRAGVWPAASAVRQRARPSSPTSRARSARKSAALPRTWTMRWSPRASASSSFRRACASWRPSWPIPTPRP